MIHAKSPREIQYMRDAGRIVARTHEELAKAAKPGISTKELDQIAEDYIISQGAVPSFIKDIVVFRHQSVRPLIML